MANYEVRRELYARYERGGIKVSRFTAKDNVEAIIKVLDNCGYGWEDEEGRTLGEQGFTMPTFEQVITELENTNGDGMDYIISIINLDSDEILYESDEVSYESEEW